jgi:transposase, IS5 family
VVTVPRISPERPPRLHRIYFQFFCGEEFFQHRLPFDRSSLTRWRQRMGEAKLTALIQESLSVATRTEAMKPKESPA